MTNKIVVVIDYEAFKGDVIKELAIATPFYNACILLKPPNEFAKLSLVEQKVNCWLSKHMHKIDWNAGNHDYILLRSICIGFTSPNALYFAKGEEKCKLLSKLFDRYFVNLEEFDCPPISKIVKDKSGTAHCSVCPSIHSNDFVHCAYNKVVGLHEWVTKHYFDIVFDYCN